MRATSYFHHPRPFKALPSKLTAVLGKDEIYSRYAVTDEAMLRERTAKLAAYLEDKLQAK